MAKSLFASLPHQMPKKVVDSQQQTDDFVVKVGNNFHPLGNIQGQFHEFHKAYSSPNHSRTNIGLEVFYSRTWMPITCFNLRLLC